MEALDTRIFIRCLPTGMCLLTPIAPTLCTCRRCSWDHRRPRHLRQTDLYHPLRRAVTRRLPRLGLGLLLWARLTPPLWAHRLLPPDRPVADTHR